MESSILFLKGIPIMTKFCLITILSLATSLTFAAPNLQDATNDVCQCLEEPNNQAKQLIELFNQAQASGDISQVVAAQGDLMKVIKASEKCFKRLPEKYPDIDKSKELQKQVMDMTAQQCPNPAAKLPAGK